MTTDTAELSGSTSYSSPSTRVKGNTSAPSSTSSSNTEVVTVAVGSVISKKKEPATSSVPTILPPVTATPERAPMGSRGSTLTLLISNSAIARGGPCSCTCKPSAGIVPSVLKVISMAVCSDSIRVVGVAVTPTVGLSGYSAIPSVTVKVPEF